MRRPPDNLPRWPLVVCGDTPAAYTNSPAVSARPLISAARMLARTGSPTRAATSAMRTSAVTAKSSRGEPTSENVIRPATAATRKATPGAELFALERAQMLPICQCETLSMRQSWNIGAEAESDHGHDLYAHALGAQQDAHSPDHVA